MTSPGTAFVFGSATSAREIIQSYRRAQYFVAGATVVPSTPAIPGPLHDNEAAWNPLLDEDEDEDEEVERLRGGAPGAPYEYVGDWDTSQSETSERSPLSMPISSPSHYHGRVGIPIPSSTGPQANRPSTHDNLAFSPSTHNLSSKNPLLVKDTHGPPISTSYNSVTQNQPTVMRRASTGAAKRLERDYGGRSTFGQTLFNSIAILLGIGMLSEPIAFAYAGWMWGTLIILLFGFMTCYTAKLLAHIILSDPSLRSYADIGRKAFGPRSNIPISILFCSELFAVSVVLITLYADSLYTILPSYSTTTYKILGLFILIPTVFFPLSLLSYASILGILSTLMIIAVVIIDGLSKRDAPGSLWSPAETSLGAAGMGKLGIAFGLFMAGFSGHAVIPSLARDMVDPNQFDKMINWAFAIATAVYAMIGCAGYLMFGSSVSEEISMDLLRTPGYNPLLNKTALWMLVISPLSKFALATRPVNVTLEIMLGLEAAPHHTSPEDKSPAMDEPARKRSAWKRILIGVERVTFTSLAIAVSILVPEFSTVMAFLGSFSAFVICVVGPIAASAALAGRCGVLDASLLAIACILAIWGTVAAVLAA